MVLETRDASRASRVCARSARVQDRAGIATIRSSFVPSTSCNAGGTRSLHSCYCSMAR